MKRRTEESEPPRRDLISSCLIKLLFFGPNLYVEEMRNTHARTHAQKDFLEYLCKHTQTTHTHPTQNTRMDFFTQCGSFEGVMSGEGKQTEQRRRTRREKHDNEGMFSLHNLYSCLLVFCVCTHTYIYVYFPCWKPISSWVSRGERDNDSHIPPRLRLCCLGAEEEERAVRRTL